MSVSQVRSPDMPKQYPNWGWKLLLQSFLFFVLYFLYLWLYVDLKLIYHGAGVITDFPVFYRGWNFFVPFLSYPGGLVEYLSAFLSQLFFYSWAGALVVTIQAWLMCLCLGYLLNIATTKRNRLVWYALPILVLILYTQYTCHFVTTMAFLAALATACIYLKTAGSHDKVIYRVIVYLVLSAVLYYLAGGALILFAAICAIYEFVFQFRWKMSLFCLLCAAAIAYILGFLVFQLSLVDSFSSLLPFWWKTLKYVARRRSIEVVYVLYLLPPSILLVYGLLHKLANRIHSRRERTKKKHRNKSSQLLTNMSSWYRQSPNLRWTLESALLIAIACGAVLLSRDENLRTRFKVDFCAYHKMWPELLTAAQQNPSDPFTAQAVNRALYHLGRLGYDMFSWPQHPDYLFLSDEKYKWMYWQIFDVFLDIGVINLAENALAECLEGLGSRPMVLQRLALINMVKGNSGSARIYLGALSKTLFHCQWANDYLDRLKTDPNLSNDQYIQHLRSVSLDKDCPAYALVNETTLFWLLEKNSRNRMAFEYLMAYYMLNKYLGKFVQNIGRLRDFGYRDLPAHYQEAALIHAYGTGKPLDMGGYLPSPQKHGQIREFTKILAGYGGDRNAASGELSKKFRNTYYFYYIYTPSTRKSSSTE